jgi:hypothetical protein
MYFIAYFFPYHYVRWNRLKCSPDLYDHHPIEQDGKMVTETINKKRDGKKCLNWGHLQTTIYSMTPIDRFENPHFGLSPLLNRPIVEALKVRSAQ